MLKIRNLIFALGLSPLIFAVWQLPSQAGGNPNGTESGNNNLQGSTITPFSNPVSNTQAGTGTVPTTTTTTTIGGETVTTTAVTTQATTTAGTPVTIPIVPGVEITILSGVSTDGNTSVATTTTGGDTTATVAVTAATVESTSSSITVTDSATGKTVVITIAPQNQVEVNQSAAAIIQNVNSIISGGITGGITGGTTGGTTVSVDAADIATLLTGGAGAQQAATNVTNGFTAAGINLERATALVTALTGLFASNTGSLPNQPVAMTTSGQLVASTKAFKPVTIIAQGGAGLSVNINKLNDAIVAYNGIILKSEPKAVKNFSRNGGFVGIGGILKELRTVIK